MKQNWTTIGKEYNGTDQQKADINKAIDSLEWHEIPQTGSLNLPMSQGFALKTAIKELRLPNVTHVAHGWDMAPFTILGIKCAYKDVGPVNVYLLDIGSEVVVLRHDVVNAPAE